MADRVVSVMKSISQLDEVEQLLIYCLEGYLELVTELEAGLRQGQAEAGMKQAERDSKALRAGLRDAPSRERIGELRRAGVSALARWKANRDRGVPVEELRSVLRSLAEATSRMRGICSRQHGEMTTIASSLSACAETDNISALREQIRTHASKLIECAESVKQENESLVENLDREMRHYQQRLSELNEEARTDPLTGLHNRRALAAAIDEHAATGKPAVLILVDVRRMRQINEQYGHSGGDQVLLQVAQRLRACCDARGFLARWESDKFVTIMEGKVSEVLSLSQSVTRAICGRYMLNLAGTPQPISVAATVTVVEHRAGEPSDRLMTRADQGLRQAKQLH